MAINYTEYDGTTVNVMETEAGTIGGQKRNVHGLAPAIITQFASMVTSLGSIATAIVGTLTVGLPSGAATSAKQDTIIGHVDGIETLIGTGNTSLGSIVTALASQATAALQTAANATLVSVLAALAPSAAVCDQVPSTNSSLAFASQVCALGCWIKNISTGSQIAYIKPGATASASNGYQLLPGEERWFPCTNMSSLRHFSSASGANLCFEAI